MVHSLITLFPPTATKFDTNGLGSLGEAISCIVTEERNGSFELEMVYPTTGKHYKDIVNQSILYVKPNPVDSPQAFRIYAYSKPMDGLVTYQAAHISYDLSGYPVKPFTASSAVVAFSYLTSNPFTFWTDVATSGTIKIETPSPIRSVLGGSENSILEIFGGEYKFDNFVVRHYNHRGMNRGVVIRYGKNLIDVKQEENVSGIYTDILPYWYGEVDELPTLVTLPELTIATISESYYFRRIYPLDMSSSFQDKPFVVDLRDAANEWIKVNNPSIPSTSFDISFAQLEQVEEYENLVLLERVELCDEVTVEYPDFGISATAKVIKTVYNVMSGSYDSVTLGDVRSTLSQTIYGQEGYIKNTKDAFQSELNGAMNSLSSAFNKNLNEVKSELEQATENATNWITNGKGYVVAVKNSIGQWTEICILDNPDITKAVKVWRWNNGGLGYSSHGYNGPYALAITQDGQINADFILAGSMSASLIKTGVLNADLIKSGFLSASRIKSGTLYLGGTQYGSNIILYETRNGADVKYGEIGDFTDISAITVGNLYTKYIFDDSDFKNYFFDLSLANFPGSVGLHQNIAMSGSTAVRFYCYGGSGSGPVSSIKEEIGAYLTSGVDEDGNKILSGPYTGLIVDTGFDGMYVDKIISPNSLNIMSVSKDYGTRVLTSNTSTTSIVEDIGEGEIDDEGKCYVYFDDVFLKAAATNVEYQIFLQKEGAGDIWVSEKTNQYFVVEGTKNLKFSWNAKVKKIGEEYERLTNYQVPTIEKTDYEEIYLTDMTYLSKESVREQEDMQMNDLKDILKEKEEAIYEAIK